MTAPETTEEPVQRTELTFQIIGEADDTSFDAVLGQKVAEVEPTLQPPALRVLKRCAAFLGRSPFFNPGGAHIQFNANATVDERGRGTINVDVQITDIATEPPVP